LYLFILESLGAQELILIGIVALVVFGPRKLPELARKAGKMMRELRSVSNDFRETWEKEVNFEEDRPNEVKELKDETVSYFDEGQTFGEEIKTEPGISSENRILPEIKEVSSEDFKRLVEERKKLQKDPVEKTAPDKSEWF
jgi:Tat protein translocase TatB subunit